MRPPRGRRAGAATSIEDTRVENSNLGQAPVGTPVRTSFSAPPVRAGRRTARGAADLQREMPVSPCLDELSAGPILDPSIGLGERRRADRDDPGPIASRDPRSIPGVTELGWALEVAGAPVHSTM